MGLRKWAAWNLCFVGEMGKTLGTQGATGLVTMQNKLSTLNSINFGCYSTKCVWKVMLPLDCKLSVCKMGRTITRIGLVIYGRGLHVCVLYLYMASALYSNQVVGT